LRSVHTATKTVVGEAQSYKRDCKLLCDVKETTDSVLIQLGWSDSFEGSSPCWSPDSKYVYYDFEELSYYEVGGEKFHVIRKYSRIHEFSETVLFDPMKSQASPCVSPDGKRIAYTVWDDSLSVWLFSLSSEKSHMVSSGFLALEAPTWSPTGDAVCFSALTNASYGKYWQVFKVDLASRKTDVIHGEPVHKEGAIWCADDWVYYSRGRMTPIVHRMSPDGLKDEYVCSIGPASSWAVVDDFLPQDKALIVFWTDEPKPMEMYRGTKFVLADGQKVGLSFDGIELWDNVRISPNGKYVAFQQFTESGPRITVARITSVNPQ